MSCAYTATTPSDIICSQKALTYLLTNLSYPSAHFIRLENVGCPEMPKGCRPLIYIVEDGDVITRNCCFWSWQTLLSELTNMQI